METFKTLLLGFQERDIIHKNRESEKDLMVEGRVIVFIPTASATSVGPLWVDVKQAVGNWELPPLIRAQMKAWWGQDSHGDPCENECYSIIDELISAKHIFQIVGTRNKTEPDISSLQNRSK